MPRLTPAHIVWLKVVIHLTALFPVTFIYYQAFTDQLGGDPVQEILHFTGIGAFNLLLITLCISPLAKFAKQGQLVKTRRLLGLYAFVYALCHFLSYLLFDLQLDWPLLLTEIIKRPYITVGFAALLILTTLAVTSNAYTQKALARRWQTLHNTVYVAAILVSLHFIWSVKSDVTEPLVYILMLSLLLLARRKKFSSMMKGLKRKK